MLLDFQSSAFDRSATCPGSAAPRQSVGHDGGRMITTCYFFLFLDLPGSAGGAVRVFLGSNCGGMSRQGSFLPRFLSGVLRGGTFRALRVFGASSPGGACSGGISWAPA